MTRLYGKDCMRNKEWIFNISLGNYIKLGSYPEPGCGKPDLKTILEEIKNDGFGIELWMNWNPDKNVFDRPSWPNIRKWCEGCKNLTIHSECVEKDFESVRKEIELASYLKARALIVHVLNFGVVEAEEKLAIDEKYFCEVLKLAEKNNVILALENGRFESLKSFLAIGGKSPVLKIILDIGHINIPSSSLLPADCPDPAKVFFEEFKDRLVHFHFHDNSGKTDDHMVPGDGNIDWKRVLKQLNEINAPHHASFEIRTNFADARQASLRARDYLNGLTV